MLLILRLFWIHIFGLITVFYLYFLQIFFLNQEKVIPNHVVLRTDQEYRHNNYFKFFNSDKKTEYLLVDVFKKSQLTSIKFIPLIRIINVFFLNIRYLNKYFLKNLNIRGIFSFNTLFSEAISEKPTSRKRINFKYHVLISSFSSIAIYSYQSVLFKSML